MYENNALQFMSMAEGRIRLTPTIGNATARLDYDYFLKDHLGNIRAVLTDEQQTAHYLATMETGNRAVENQLFDNIDAYAVNKSVVPGGYPTDNTTSPNDYVSRLNGINNQVGPSIVLKVMAGDELDLGVKYFYRPQAGSTTQWNADMQYWNVIDALTRLVQGASGISKALNPTDDYYGWVNLFGPAVVGFTNNQSAIPSGKPKASLNWLFVNEQFKGDGTTQSGSLNVNSPDELLTLAHNITIQKNGYLYIYISNETANWPVFFDNLSVQHKAGPLREETHFYPFGLTMHGISSKALGSLENRRKFNDGTELENKEFSDGSGLELYSTNFRSLDPQLGRFWQIDPLAEALVSISPYQYANNNPIYFNDPLGLLSDSLHPVVLPTVTVTAKKSDNTTPGQLGMEWLTGRGPREHHFKDKDPFTQMLRKHEHVNDTKNIIIDSIQGGVRGRITGTNGYSLSGIGGVGKYLRDYSTLLTGGLTGNLAVTYLGSYGLNYEVVSIDEESGTAQVHFSVSNSSTAASGFRPPVIGYTETWKNTVGKQINETFSSGPMSKTTQTVEWTETIQWKRGHK